MKPITEALQIKSDEEYRGTGLNRITELRLMKAKFGLEKALDCVELLLNEQEIIKINEIADTVKDALTQINNVSSSAIENHQVLKRQKLEILKATIK